MPAPFNPNSELVTVAFLNALNISAPSDFGINTTLPADPKTWNNGFVQVTGVGGSPDIDVQTRRPLMQIDCWVPSTNSSKPQWGKANTIAEDIVNAMYNLPDTGLTLSLGSNFKAALVQSAYPVGEPRRVANDPAGHARYTFDIQLIWVTVDTKLPA